MSEVPSPPFIPIWMDSLKLSPVAFRVLAHLWRRAGSDRICWPGVSSIGTACGIKKPDTVHKVLNEIEAAGLISRERRDGTSNRYTLVIPLNGIPHATGYPIKQDTTHPTPRGNGSPTERDKGIPHETGYKGSPSEGSPVQGSPMKVPHQSAGALVVGFQDGPPRYLRGLEIETLDVDVQRFKTKSWLAIQKALPILSSTWQGYIYKWKIAGTTTKAKRSDLIRRALLAGMTPHEVTEALRSIEDTDGTLVVKRCEAFLSKGTR